MSAILPSCAELARLLRGRRVVALTGAGCSTESGIPDYRGPGTARRARNPMRWSTFAGDEGARRRYWARSLVGWPRIASALPNLGHRALAAGERNGALRGVITQNVDRLHHRAGSRRVVELHGALEEVRCLVCGALEPRDDVQNRLLTANPAWSHHDAPLAPDGDADVTMAAHDFHPPRCTICGGDLKPNVVFFGENVVPEILQGAWRLYREAEVLLVVGSSLTVFSGYRFVRQARRDGVPVAIVNLGPTRGDRDAALRVDAAASATLEAIFGR